MENKKQRSKIYEERHGFKQFNRRVPLHIFKKLETVYNQWKLRKEEDDQVENYRFAYKSALEPEVQDKIFEQFNNLGEQNK